MEQETKPTPARPGTPTRQADDDRSRPRKLTWKEARELESLEARIAELEGEKADLEQAINNAGSDYQLLQSLAGRLQEQDALLEGKMARWLELSEFER
jgi:ATP-binding cassette subfamily F protein uup